MAGGHINLIFHGVFAFVFTDECIEVLVPVFQGQTLLIGSQNCAGTKGQSYYLSGVCRDKPLKRFQWKDTPIIDNTRVINRGGNALLCSFYLPFPTQLYTLRKLNIKDRDVFQGSSASKIRAETWPLVHVFRFPLGDSSKLALGGVPIPPGTKHLHISSEPPFDKHLPMSTTPKPEDCFDRLIELFPGLNLRLTDPENAPGPDNLSNQSDIPAELQDEQFSTEEKNAWLNSSWPLPSYLSLVIDNT